MKRWPVIRHVRWLWLAWRVQCWAAWWAERGIGLGVLHPHDEAALDAIWRGDL